MTAVTLPRLIFSLDVKSSKASQSPVSLINFFQLFPPRVQVNASPPDVEGKTHYAEVFLMGTSKKAAFLAAYRPFFKAGDLPGLATGTNKAYALLDDFLERTIAHRIPRYGPPSRLSEEHASRARRDVTDHAMEYLLEKGRNGVSRIRHLLLKAAGCPEHFEAQLRNTLRNFMLRQWARMNPQEELLRKRVEYVYKDKSRAAKGRAVFKSVRGIVGLVTWASVAPAPRSDVRAVLERESRALAHLVRPGRGGAPTIASLRILLTHLTTALGRPFRVRHLFPELYTLLGIGSRSESLANWTHTEAGEERQVTPAALHVPDGTGLIDARMDDEGFIMLDEAPDSDASRRSDDARRSDESHGGAFRNGRWLS